MSISPRVSIIVPSYNHSKFVKTLIDSIYSQTYKDFELIVIDDGSKDSSVELLTELSGKFGFEFISKANEGICKTLNLGISKAKGEFILIIASDDYMPEYRLEEQVKFMDGHRDVDVVAGSLTLIDNDGVIKGSNKPALQGYVSFEDMLKINRILTASAFVRSSIYKRFGNYDPQDVFEDYPMWLRVLKGGGKIFNTDRMWAFYRISNPDLEKKFNWYYKGAVQSLTKFMPDPVVAKFLGRHRFVYFTKLTLLLGAKAISSYKQVFLELNIIEKMIIFCVAITPGFIRSRLMLRLKLKL